MNGKILYVEDDANVAFTTMASDNGLLSGLIDDETKKNLKLISSSNSLPARSKIISDPSITQATDKGTPKYTAAHIKKIVDKDSRIVYQYDFIEALSYIKNLSDEIALCILDRNLKCNRPNNDIKEQCINMGLEFTDEDAAFINPIPSNSDTRREGDYLFEILHEKFGNEFLDKVYFLSAYPTDDLKKDRHHAFLLRQFDNQHYVEKDNSDKIARWKSHFNELKTLKNYDIIQKYFPDIFDVVRDKDLRSYLAESISAYDEKLSTHQKMNNPVGFFANFRKIIEEINNFITDVNRSNSKPFVKVYDPSKVRNLFNTKIQNDIRMIEKCQENRVSYRFKIEIPSDQLGDLINMQGQSDEIKMMIAILQTGKSEYLRTPLSMLDAAYTICCDYLHTHNQRNGQTMLKTQAKFLHDEVGQDFMCRYVYESVKTFFVWLKAYRVGAIR